MSFYFRINPLLNSYTVPDIVREAEDILPEASPELTFWGSRVLTIRGCEGAVDLGTVARKILECERLSPTEQYRPRVTALRRRIQELYAESDRQVQNAPRFTKIMATYPSWLVDILLAERPL